MFELWIALADIPAEGREFTYTEPAIWVSRWQEYKLPFQEREALQAAFRILPQKDGLLIIGDIQGSVLTPCDRCTSDTELPIYIRFEEFEPFPEADEAPKEKDDANEFDDAPGLIRKTRAGLEFNAADFLWEQFSLAAPVKPVCDEECKGLCPECGADLNQESCGCGEQGLDPRLAALRGLKIGD